jgi:hypothetical protein
LLRPRRGGFLRSIRCGLFIKESLLGNGPYGSSVIDPEVGAPQAEIFFHYKNALRRTTAMDRATRMEEKRARREKRRIDPARIEQLYQRHLAGLPYKASGARYHSFVTYFSTVQKLTWVEPSGVEEPSEFQDKYPSAQPRRYFRLTAAGRRASDRAWANPQSALYG